MSLDPSSDAALFHALRVDDEQALDALITRWERPLLAFAWRYSRNRADAEDAVAETFVRLHQRRHQLRPDTRLSAWLFTTLTNLCRNQHRWRRRHPAEQLDLRDEQGGETPLARALASEAPRPAAILERAEAATALREAIDRLPHDLKTAVLLHHFENLSYRDIGEIVGCSERGVETRLYRAKKQLRGSLSATRQ